MLSQAIVHAVWICCDLYGVVSGTGPRGLIQGAVREKSQQYGQADPTHADVSIKLTSILEDILNQRQISLKSQLRVQFVKGHYIPLEEDISKQDLRDSAESPEVIGADGAGKLADVLTGLNIHLYPFKDEGKYGPIGCVRAPALRCGKRVITSLEEIIDDVIEQLLVEIEVARTRVYNSNIS